MTTNTDCVANNFIHFMRRCVQLRFKETHTIMGYLGTFSLTAP